MKYKEFILTLFDGEGGAGNSGTAGNTGNGTGNAGGTFSYEQAEEIANARAERAECSALSSWFRQQGMSEQEATQALADFRAQREANKPNLDAITKERDDARAELQGIKNAQTLTKLGVKDDDLDYVTFKVAALMKEDSKLDFKKAAEKYLKENPRYAGDHGSYRVFRSPFHGTQTP